MEDELKIAPLTDCACFCPEVAPGEIVLPIRASFWLRHGYEQFPIQPGTPILVIVFRRMSNP